VSDTGQGFEMTALNQAEHGFVFHLQFARDFFGCVNIHDFTCLCRVTTPSHEDMKRRTLCLSVMNSMKPTWRKGVRPTARILDQEVDRGMIK
jgi:hypothetical protein